MISVKHKKEKKELKQGATLTAVKLSTLSFLVATQRQTSRCDVIISVSWTPPDLRSLGADQQCSLAE